MTSERMRAPRAARACSAAVLMLGAVVITPVLIGVLALQVQDELEISNRALSLCVTWFWVCTALTAALGGRHVDRLGWRRMAAIGLAACAVGQLGIAAGGSVFSLVACLTVAGFAYGVIAPTSNLVLVEEIPARLRGTALGAKQSVAPVAGLLAGLAVPFVALTIGWRWSFVLVALLPIAGVALSWPPTVRARRSDSGAGPGPGAQDAPASDGSVPGPQSAPASAGRSISLTQIVVAAGLGTLSIGALTTFSVRTMTDAGVEVSVAGLVISAASLAALLVRVVAGWLTDRYKSDGLRPASLVILSGAVGMVGMASGDSTLTVLGTVLAFCGAWGWPALLLLGVLTHHAAQPAAASGKFQLGTALGAAVGPLLFAAVSDLAGFAVAWMAVAACTVGSALLVTLGGRGRGRAGQETPPKGGSYRLMPWTDRKVK